MSIYDLVRFSHPLLIANEGDEKYWVGQNGTCFVVQRSSRLFAIMARHCVTPSSAGHLLIACLDREFAPLLAGYQRTLERTIEEDEQDLYIVEVDRSRMSTKYRSALRYIDLPSDVPYEQLNLNPESELCIPGFPKDRAILDYDAKVFHPKPTVLAATYVRRSKEFGCHEIKFYDNRVAAPSLDGFSGSPVYYFPKKDGIRYWSFVGMLLRGHGSKGRFLDATVIARGIDNIIKYNPWG